MKHTDAWENLANSLGTLSLDPQMGMAWREDPILPDPLLDSMYRANDLVAKIVDWYPKSAFRRGIVSEVQEEIDRLAVLRRFAYAAKMARLFGGSGILIVTDEPWKPETLLRPIANGVSISALRVYDRRRIGAVGDIRSAETLRVLPRYGSGFEVHASRLIRIYGDDTTEEGRDLRQGWGASVIDRIAPVIRSFESAYLAAGLMLQTASEGWLRMKGLIDMLTTDREKLAARAEVLQVGRGIAKVLLLDEGEEYGKTDSSFASIPDILDRFGSRLAAATGLPVQEILGESPGGLSATGEAGTRKAYDEVTMWRTDQIDGPLRQLFRVAGWGKFSWPPLWEATETEVAALRKAQAETDAIHVGLGALLPEDVAKGRYGAEGWTSDLVSSVSDPPSEFPTAGGPIPEVEDAEDETIGRPELSASLAERMNAIEADHCRHGRKVRCDHCGIVRDLTPTRAADQSIQWGGPWKGI